MEDLHFIADSKRAQQRSKFTGITTFVVENNVVTIECGDGRKFVSPISEISGTYHSLGGIWGGNSNYQRSYKLRNAKGDGIDIKVKDWDGFRTGLLGYDDRRLEMFNALESSPNCKASSLEKIEQVISVLAIIFLVIYFAIYFFS